MSNNPTVTVKNDSNQNVYIKGDPDWDDQALLLSGKKAHGVYTLAPNHSVQLSVHGADAGNEYMIGVIFADGQSDDAGSYHLTIGQSKNGGLLGVTESDGEAKVKYTVSQQTAWSMTLDFTNS